MRCLLLYDIPNDRIRQRVADACLDFGLTRIQYSAYLGELSSTYSRALFTEIDERIRGYAATVHLFPLHDQSWQGRRMLLREGKR